MTCFRKGLATFLSVSLALTLWMSGAAAYADQLNDELGEVEPAVVEDEPSEDEEAVDEGAVPEDEAPSDEEGSEDGDLSGDEAEDEEAAQPVDDATDGEADEDEPAIPSEDDPVDPAEDDPAEPSDDEEGPVVPDPVIPEPEPDEDEPDLEVDPEEKEEDEREEEAKDEGEDETDAEKKASDKQKDEADKQEGEDKQKDKAEKKADDDDDELVVQASGDFTDVPSSHWARGVIKRAAKLGLVEGYTGKYAGMFGPEDGITRGEVVVILWRMAGKPDITPGAKSFSDVSSGKFYYKAVEWASASHVVSGYGGDRAGQFGPNDPVTREQLATMLTSYASRMGGLSTGGSADSYAAMGDASSVSAYARESLGWCFACGLMTGSSGNIKPQDGATRAEATKMLLALRDRVVAPWQLSVAVSDEYVRKGTSVTLYPTLTGTPGVITYTYTKSLAQWSASVDSAVIQLDSAGIYQLTVRATDEEGRSQAASIAVTSYGLVGMSLESTGSDAWKAKADIGVSGGVPGIEYRYTWEKADGSNGGVIREWSSDSSVSFDKSAFSGATGKINITVEASDGYGSFGTKTKAVQVAAMDDMTMRAQSFSSSTDLLILADCWYNWVGVYEGYQGNWTRIKHFRCTSGAPWSPTIKGTFTVTGKGYSFGSGYTCYYYTQFYGDYLFHSILYDEGTFNVQDGRLGESLSHGCIRLALEDAKWIYDNVPFGTTVHTYA